MKKNLLFVLFSVLCLTVLAQAPPWQWAVNAGTTGNELATSSALDANGNYYLTGHFTSASINFGTNSLINNFTGTSDIFLTKYDASGTVQWAKNFGSVDGEIASSVTTDANGNVLLAGWFASPSVVFGTTTLTNAGSGTDIFLVKFDPQGNVLWAKSAGGINAERCNSVCTDAQSNVIITGWYNSATINFGSGNLTNSGTNTNEFFLAKFDASGNNLWARTAGGANADGGNSVCTDGSGNIYTTGVFASTAINFGTGSLNNASGGTKDIFIAKYDGNGNALWSVRAGGSGDENSNSIIFTSNSAIITGGYNSTSITFGSTTLNNIAAGLNDVFLARYDASGNNLWAKTSGGSDDEAANSVATDGNGNIYITGYFISNSASFSSFTINNSSQGYRDIFSACYLLNGNISWAQATGGSFDETGNNICANLSNIYVAGVFNSPSLAFGTHTIFKGCGDDVFAAKMGATTGLWYQTTNNDIIVFPNPFSSTLAINCDNAKDIGIVNSLGEIIYQVSATTTLTEIDLAHLPQGIYFVLMRTEKGVMSKKIIKQ